MDGDCEMDDYMDELDDDREMGATRMGTQGEERKWIEITDSCCSI